MKNLKRFLDLARQGRQPGSSGGERRAARLAHQVAEDVPGLDQGAVAGLLELVSLAHRNPSTAGDLVGDRRKELDARITAAQAIDILGNLRRVQDCLQRMEDYLEGLVELSSLCSYLGRQKTHAQDAISRAIDLLVDAWHPGQFAGL